MKIKKNIFYESEKSRGQASIEFTLVLPVLILIILIVSQLGYLVYLQNILEHAAREGARVLVTTNSNSNTHDCIYRICERIKREELDIEIIPSSQNQRHLGDTISVRLNYNYTGFASITKMLPGGCIHVKSSCNMRMECGNE